MSSGLPERVLLLETTPPRFARVRAQIGAGVPVTTERSVQAKVAIVDLAPDLERGLRVIDELRPTGAQIIALAAAKEPDVILRAMRAGACEFAVVDDTGELADIVARLLRRGSAESARGAVLAFFAPKGGVGATTLACNTAAALAAEGKRVLLVDLDRQLGAVLTFLDITPQFTIPEVVKNLHRLDRELFESSLARHASGVFVLAQPESFDDDAAVTGPQITALLEFATRHFDWVVCDGLRGLDECAVAALDAARVVEMVVTQDVAALRNAKRFLDVFQRLSYGDDKIALLVNRHQPKAAIDVDAIRENLGVPVRATVADDPAAASAALNRGLLVSAVAPRSPMASDIAQLAAALSGATKERRHGLFDSLFGKKTEGAPDVPRRTTSIA